MMRLLVAGATATFGLYACVMLLPRYYQQTQGVSAPDPGCSSTRSCSAS